MTCGWAILYARLRLKSFDESDLSRVCDVMCCGCLYTNIVMSNVGNHFVSLFCSLETIVLLGLPSCIAYEWLFISKHYFLSNYYKSETLSEVWTLKGIPYKNMVHIYNISRQFNLTSSIWSFEGFIESFVGKEFVNLLVNNSKIIVSGAWGFSSMVQETNIRRYSAYLWSCRLLWSW